MADLVHPPSICSACERELPPQSDFCPYCYGEDGRRGAYLRGAFIGGVFGLIAGGLAASLWSAIIGPENLTWSMTFGAVFAGATFGVICGMFSQRRKD